MNPDPRSLLLSSCTAAGPRTLATDAAGSTSLPVSGAGVLLIGCVAAPPTAALAITSLGLELVVSRPATNPIVSAKATPTASEAKRRPGPPRRRREGEGDAEVDARSADASGVPEPNG